MRHRFLRKKPNNTTTFQYNLYAVTNSKMLAPEGYRVANQQDWVNLLTYLGGLAASGVKLKSTLQWNEQGNTNESGFTALPLGTRAANGAFSGKGTLTKYWINNL